MSDLIDREQTIVHLKKRLIETAINNTGVTALCDSIFVDTADNRIETWINEIPSSQSEIVYCKDCVHNELGADAGNAVCELYYGMTNQMGYCHMGERRYELFDR